MMAAWLLIARIHSMGGDTRAYPAHPTDLDQENRVSTQAFIPTQRREGTSGEA